MKLGDARHVWPLKIEVNKSKTIRLKRTPEVAVANPEFADAVPLAGEYLSIIGKKVGQTRVTVVDKESKELLATIDVNVVAGEVDRELRKSLQQALHQDPQLAGVRSSVINGRIMLSGLVPDVVAQSRALAIASQFLPEAENLDENGDTPKPTDPKHTTVKVELNTERKKPSTDKETSRIINAMTVRASQQVMLEVRFVEVDRTAARDLGVNLAGVNKNVVGSTGSAGYQSQNPSFNAATLVNSAIGGLVPLAGIPSGATPFGQAIISLLNNSSASAEFIIQALEKRGMARRLAEPNLVTLSGDTANFLAGGEIPIPVAQTGALGTITLEYKKFGIGLAFTPTVLSDGQINLKIAPEVSDIDTAPGHSFTYGGGITVPALSVRRASATVELRDGQSFAIAGLLDNKHTKDQTQLPWLGEVPVLGALFRSASYLKQETELVIVVTPRLVKPATPGQRLAVPTDAKLAGNDRDFFLRGQAEVDKPHGGPYGHIIDAAPHEWTASVTTIREGGDHVSYK